MKILNTVISAAPLHMSVIKHQVKLLLMRVCCSIKSSGATHLSLVTMAAFSWVVLLLAFGMPAVFADMKLDCQQDFVSLVWTETRPQVDTSMYRLGNCFPTRVTATQAFFRVELNDCKFERLVTEDRMLYSTNLTHISSPSSQFVPFRQLVTCVYQRPKDYYPMIYYPVFNTYSKGELVFHMGITNNDFTGPAETRSFSLGSFIPILASVQQMSHQPLQLFIEECVATTSPQLLPDGDKYTIIANKGCLVDSKVSLSRFMPRQKSSDILLLLQAFRFSTGEQVYLHCTLVAWDPAGLDKTKKACNYVQGYGWELMDNTQSSNLCECCESSCSARRTRSTRLENGEMIHEALLGPITIV